MLFRLDPQSRRLEMVDDPQRERVVGTHHRQIDALLQGVIAKGIQGVGWNGEVGDGITGPEKDARCTRIARGANQFGDMRRACEFPNQGVFTSARSNDQNLHLSAQSNSAEVHEEADLQFQLGAGCTEGLLVESVLTVGDMSAGGDRWNLHRSMRGSIGR